MSKKQSHSSEPQEPSQPSASDALLVERAKNGDARAYELLVIKYQRRIERLIARMVRDSELVHDIAQETFIAAWQALGRFRGESQFYTWLYKIAVNTTKKILMGLKRDSILIETPQNKELDENDETFRSEQELTTDSTPETEFVAREIALAVQKVLAELPEDLRQAVTLREIEGFSYEEIAQIMDCPVGTIRSRIFRAREAIAEKIRPMLSHQSSKRW